MIIPHDINFHDKLFDYETFYKFQFEVIHPSWANNDSWKILNEIITRDELANFILENQTIHNWHYINFLMQQFGLNFDENYVPIFDKIPYEAFNQKALWTFVIIQAIRNQFPEEIFECETDITLDGKKYDIHIQIQGFDFLIDIITGIHDIKKYETGYNYSGFDINFLQNLSNLEMLSILKNSDEIKENITDVLDLIKRELIHTSDDEMI